MASSPHHFMANRRGKKMETVTGFIFLSSRITADMTAAMKLKDLLLGRKAMINLDSVLKSRDITLRTELWFFQ